MRKLFIYLIILAIGFAAGTFLNSEDPQKLFKIQAMRAGQNGLIDPLLEYELDSNLYKKELKPFEDKIRTLKDKLKSQGKADRIAVYFRDLNNGPWFGIHEDENFFPASLLKVPIMMVYFKEAENNPDILKKKITYDEGYRKILGHFSFTQYVKPQKSIKPGETYTIEELINYMILYSDNNAKDLLIINLDDMNKLAQFYTDLGISSPPELRGPGDILSVHEYGTLYRVLYNASYLSKDMSKKALNLLVDARFDKGISAGIPKNIQFANKFGEYADDNFKQLHDCGIVYYPNNPYLLCIMTRGNDFPSLEYTIKEISKAVYEEVESQSKKI